MSDYVALELKRNRGWPWPEEDWGNGPLFGEDGWCQSCGVPKRPQTGELHLQRKAMRPHGVWMPYWQYDIYCMSAEIAAVVSSRFNVDLRPVRWRGESPGDAFQLVIPTVGESWFDHGLLRAKLSDKAGAPNKQCPDCKVWRWRPGAFAQAPEKSALDTLGGADVAASPEWFGVGHKAFRKSVMCRELAELLQSASPRDFEILEF